MNVLYGQQSYENNYHYTVFTPQIVEQCLAEMEFTKFIWDFSNYHMFVRTWKNPPEEAAKAPSMMERNPVVVDTTPATIITSGAMAISPPGDSEMTTGAITAADLTKIAEC